LSWLPGRVVMVTWKGCHAYLVGLSWLPGRVVMVTW